MQVTLSLNLISNFFIKLRFPTLFLSSQPMQIYKFIYNIIIYFLYLSQLLIILKTNTMKKTILIALLFSFAFAIGQVTGPKLTYASVGNLLSTPTHATTDTITNTTVKYQYGIVNGSNRHVTFQSTLDAISGTTAGTVKPQGSVDGVLYTDIAGITAFTLTNVAQQTCTFVIAPSSYQFYRIVVTPSGTQSTKIKTKALIRQ